MKFFDTFFGILFPDHCVGCKARGQLLCGVCIKKIPPASAPMQSFITSVFAYQDFRIKKLIWLLKYKNARHAARIFAPALAQTLTEFLGEENLFLGNRQILLVPIPLSKKRYQKRGYNQAELLAKEIFKLLPNEHIDIETNLLKKIIETTPQADIKKKSLRLQNLGDCFEMVAGRENSGEVIVLIDDVTTTGATLLAARKVLARGGFRKVYALTAAH